MVRQPYNEYSWEAEEIISKGKLNHIESGIETLDNEIGFADYNDIGPTITQALINLYNATKNINEVSINTYIDNKIGPIDERATGAYNIAENARNIATNKTNEIIQAIYGSNGINNENYNTLKDWITNQIQALSTTISNELTTINSNISNNKNALDQVDTRIEKALGASYYNVTNSSWDLGTNVKSVDDRITEIYNSIFGSSSAGTTKTIIEQIADLNTAIFGNTSGSGQTSLIDKIETAIGRPLEPTAAEIAANGNVNVPLLTLIENLQALLGNSTGSGERSLIDKIEEAIGLDLDGHYQGIDENDEPYNNSLYNMILDIQGVLGMNDSGSQTSNSSLITLVNQLSNAIYGTNNPTSADIAKITEPLTELVDNFYNLSVTDDKQVTTTVSIPSLLQTMYPKLGEIETVNNTLDNKVKEFSSAAERATKAYIAASPEVIGDNNYLVLKRDPEAEIATSETDIETGDYNNNTYIMLPKGGGGGEGTTYSYYSVFEVDRSDGTPIITKENGYTIKYKWITKDITTNTDSSGIRGTLRLYNNDVLVYSTAITSVNSTPEGITPEYSELNVSEYINLGTNVFRVVVTSNDTAAKNFYYTIECINPVITSTFDPSNIQSGSSILYQFTMTVNNTSINKTLNITIDGQPASNISSYSALSERIQTVTFDTPSAGTHLLEVWFSVNINGKIITSNKLRYGIICGVLNQIYISSDFKANTEVEQYTNLVVNYLARTPNQNTTNINITVTNGDPSIDENIIKYADYNEAVSTGYNQWTYQLNISMGENEENKNLFLNFIANGREDTLLSIPFVLIKNVRYNFSPVVTGLKLYLNADQRSNTASDRNVWNNSSTASERVEVSATLSNFLYYRDVDGWQRDSDNKYFLRLRNKARVEIPFSVFDFTKNDNNITDGMTFEIEFKTADVLNYNTVCIACCEAAEINNPVISRGIILTPQNGRFQVSATSETISSDDTHVELLTATNILNAYYKEEEKMTIAFVINKTVMNTELNENPKEAALMYIYINGILSGATPYTSFDNFTNGKIIIGSDQCTTDIYSIRYYSRALDYKDIIQNWISNEGNLENRTALYNKNTYNHTNDTELFAQFKLKSPETPYMVIAAKGDLNDNTVMPIQKGSENKHTVDFYFVDPTNNANNIGSFSLGDNLALASDRSTYGDGVMEIQVQGTSSQYYYRKNYKLKFSSFTQNGIVHKKKLSDADYNIAYDENDNEISRTLKSNISNEGYKLSSTSYPTWAFCIKADVASSESANNTRLTMLYDEYSRNFYMTPPQEQDPSIRQGVEGRPVVAWYYNISNNTYTLLGKYNFNNDKGTHEVFGLEGTDSEPWNGDQSWEVKNNGQSTLTLFNYSDTEWEKWYDAFESRFPDQDDASKKLNGNDDKDITHVTKENQDKWTAGLKEVVKWVNDTVQLTSLTDGHDVEATDECINAFKSGFSNYFNLNAMTFFYVFTEFFLMVDNRAKNMFLTRYLLTNERNSSYDTTNLTKDGTNRGNYFGWFTFPYDFDTAIGIDNNGRIRFDYHYESGDLQPDGTSVVFNGQRSKLWKAFEKAYANEIAAMYKSFISRINYDYVENLFEQHQKVWSEVIFNEDMLHKYVEWGNAYLYMLLGSKESHRKWWLSNRFRYLNSKYQVGKNEDRIYLRVAPGNYALTLSTYADSYINIEIGANGMPNTVRTLRGDIQTLQYTANESQAQGQDGIETIIYPASALNSINGIASLMINEADFSQANKLESLILGSPTIINTKLASVRLGQNSVLRHFDMRNYSAYSEPIDLSTYISLETVYLSGTRMISVGLPSGGILVTVQYPETITSIRIENQPYLTNLIIGNRLPFSERSAEDIAADVPIYSNDSTNDYSNITSLYLDNVGVIDEQNHSNSIDSTKIIMQMPIGSKVHINNFVWSMSAQSFYPIYQKIIQMNGFEEDGDSTTPYIGGTLYLNGDFPAGFSVEDINREFKGRVKVYWTDSQGNVFEYHTIKYYGLNNDLLLTQLVAKETADPQADLFTEEYLIKHNEDNKGWHDGDNTREGFGGWEENIDFNNITQDWDLHAKPIIQVKLNYVMLTATPGETVSAHKYYNMGQIVQQYYDNTQTFVRDYYLYSHNYWTMDGTDYTTLAPEDTSRAAVYNYQIESTEVQTFYAVYSKDNAKYEVRVYNTNTSGEPVGEPIKVITNKTVNHTNDDTHLLKINELNDCNPLINTAISIDGYANDANKSDEERQYRFLNWRPYIDNNYPLTITGDMNVYITYYYVDDIFTNYFLNKLVNCTLPDNITDLPEGAFFHNSNLRKITMPSIKSVGKYGFCNQHPSELKIYIFDEENNDIVLEDNAFSYMNNAIIIFKTTGQVYVKNNTFSYCTNCNIFLPNTSKPIRAYDTTSLSTPFSSFVGNTYKNQIFVSSTAYNSYMNSSSTDGVPNNFKVNNRTETIFDGKSQQTSVSSILEGANLDDLIFS